MLQAPVEVLAFGFAWKFDSQSQTDSTFIVHSYCWWSYAHSVHTRVLWVALFLFRKTFFCKIEGTSREFLCLDDVTHQFGVRKPF